MPANEHIRDLSAFARAGIVALCNLREADLQAKVVEPLLREEGFTQVRDRSGSVERGKDLIAVKYEFGKAKLYAIQIKKFRATGRQAHSKALGHLLTQLRQAVCEDVLDPITNTPRPPDRCYFITPYEISSSAFDSAINQLRESERRDVMVIDGPILVDRLIKHEMYDVLESIGGVELHYKMRVASAVGHIAESHVFGLREALELDDIYVQMSLGQDYADIVDAYQGQLKAKERGVMTGTVEEVGSIRDCCKTWGVSCVWYPPRKVNAERAAIERAKLKARQSRLEKRIAEIRAAQTIIREIGNRRGEQLSESQRVDLTRARQTVTQFYAKFQRKASRLQREGSQIDPIQALEDDLIKITKQKVFEFDSVRLIRAIQSEMEDHIRGLSRLASEELSDGECTAIIRDGMELSQKLRSTRRVSGVRTRCWAGDRHGSDGDADRVRCFPQVPADRIEKIRIPAYVVGPPGSGKSTLLRRLVRRVAQKPHDQLPILVYLLRVADASEEGLTDACWEALNSQGCRIGRKPFVANLRSGKYALFFDGLDETGERAEPLMAALRMMAVEYGKCRLVFTCRDSFDFGSMESAFKVKLLPFSDEQLATFLRKWFASNPSACAGINEWLSANPKMRDAARIPLIAALLCSLYAADADMPSTESELYQERFDLLLGRWDRAKGVGSMTVNLRNRYWHFLMSIASSMHREMRRSMSQSDVTDVAKQYYDKSYHQSADAMVMDCIHRGLLEQNEVSELSCGHFTYQEFLVGKWLAEQNSADIVWRELTNPWWAKAVDFYATLKQDITRVVEIGMKHNINSAIFRRLDSLIELAPLTSKTVFAKFRRLPWDSSR